MNSTPSSAILLRIEDFEQPCFIGSHVACVVPFLIGVVCEVCHFVSVFHRGWLITDKGGGGGGEERWSLAYLAALSPLEEYSARCLCERFLETFPYWPAPGGGRFATTVRRSFSSRDL